MRGWGSCGVKVTMTATPHEAMLNHFNPRPKIRAAGDTDIEAIYSAVGRALVSWEWTENHFAHLFGAIVSPGRVSLAAQRAYGSIVTARARREMLEKAGDVFFADSSDSRTKKMFDTATKLHRYGSERRNDIAHGVVTGGPATHSGYYLAANLYTSKRSIQTGSPYFYTASQITDFANRFDDLSHLVSATRQFILHRRRS